MNTKYFFFLLLCLVLTSASSTVWNTKKLTKFTIENRGTDDGQLMHNRKNDVGSPVDPWIDPHKDDQPKHHQDEDANPHHIHFTRLGKRGRRQYLWLMVTKLIVVVMHIASLIYGYMQLVH